MKSWEQMKARRAKEPGYREAYQQAALAYELGCRVRELRQRAGMSQTELARRLGTSQPAVARMEAGGSDPRLSTIRRVAEVFGVPITVGASNVCLAAVADPA